MAAKPMFNAYTVSKYNKLDGSEGSEWSRIGVLYPQEDGQGFTATLTALPLDGRIVFRKPKDKTNPDAPGQPDETDEIPF